MPSSAPVFARIRRKLERATRELAKLETYLAGHVSAPDSEWAHTTLAATAVANVYNGIEDAMMDVARYIDDAQPKGEFWHQDLLEQSALPIDGVRPALLDTALYADLFELKGFRHVVRHAYGIDLQPERVTINLARARRALPMFVDAVDALQRHLTERQRDTNRA